MPAERCQPGGEQRGEAPLGLSRCLKLSLGPRGFAQERLKRQEGGGGGEEEEDRRRRGRGRKGRRSPQHKRQEIKSPQTLLA